MTLKLYAFVKRKHLGAGGVRPRGCQGIGLGSDLERATEAPRARPRMMRPGGSGAGILKSEREPFELPMNSYVHDLLVARRKVGQRDDEQPPHARKLGNNIVHHAIGEVFLLWITTQILEG